MVFHDQSLSAVTLFARISSNLSVSTPLSLSCAIDIHFSALSQAIQLSRSIVKNLRGYKRSTKNDFSAFQNALICMSMCVESVSQSSLLRWGENVLPRSKKLPGTVFFWSCTFYLDRDGQSSARNCHIISSPDSPKGTRLNTM